eukprot:Phypoly_transcript_03658.p1 GENE.Phypoly_transcript_03658~~Phypoly_transcript_03658.p1  ORF type:complete len:466 (+),score=56.83 Phypoly_transcript_03658:994-2391(+)
METQPPSTNANPVEAPARKIAKRKEKKIITAKIDSMSHDGRGVAHVGGKAVFIERAITGETVEAKIMKKKKTFEEGFVTKIIEPSPHRVTPKCQHFGYCGGCSTMHIAEDEQLRMKQQVLLDSYAHIGKIQIAPDQLFPPISPIHWNYRRKCRLSVILSKRENQIFVGFHTTFHSIGDLKRCETVDPQIADIFPVLADVITKMTIKQHIPALEVAIGDNVSTMVVRHLEPLTQEDCDLLVKFGKEYKFHMFLQSKGPESVIRIHPPAIVEDIEDLSYNIQDLTITVGPLGFFQVNREANLAMVDKALELLDVQPTETVLDLFCGVGNFTLPLAKLAKSVVGIELGKQMVQNAGLNAKRNNLHNCEFVEADLITGNNLLDLLAGKKFDKILIDPPRSGAFELAKGPLASLGAKKIVYVSCNPSTMARDACELLTQGYEVKKIGVVNMFPHTSHVESIGLFEPNENR